MAGLRRLPGVEAAGVDLQQIREHVESGMMLIIFAFLNFMITMVIFLSFSNHRCGSGTSIAAR